VLSKELRRMNDPRWYGEQDENGVDLVLIKANLRLTPDERLRRGDRATSDALRLKRWVLEELPPARLEHLARLLAVYGVEF